MKKIIALMLILSIFAVMFSSCDGKKSEVVATFNGDSYIHQDDSDYMDFYNLNIYYYTLESGETQISSYEYNTIMSAAVQSTVTLRLLEDEIARRGYSIDMEAVKKAAQEDEDIYNRLYTGGFETFCRHWNLSEDVFVTVNKLEAMKEIAEEFFVSIDKVKDSDARKYYEENTEEFIQSPHYDVNTIYLQVLDPLDANNKASVYNDAILYIEMLNSGKSWQSVADTAALKYNLEHGMLFSHYLTGGQSISKSDFVYVESLNSSIQELKDRFLYVNKISFDEMFPNGFKAYVEENNLVENTKSYNHAWETYMNYCSARYLLEFRYAITERWETGKTYVNPIYHGGYNCYVLLTFTAVEDDAGSVTFEEAEEGIIEKITLERKEKAYENFIAEKLSSAKIQVKYN